MRPYETRPHLYGRSSPTAGGSAVFGDCVIDPPPHILDQLQQLALTIGAAEPGLDGDLVQLTGSLTAIVAGYVGLKIIIVHTGHPVVLSVHDDDPAGRAATTSVGIALTAVSTTFEIGSRAVFYSRTPGSLVDLAADLAYALHGDADDVQLDADLPFVHGRSALTGLDELATVQRAIGVLIDRGQLPHDAAETLHRSAAAVGLTTHAFAVQLLLPDQ